MIQIEEMRIGNYVYCFNPTDGYKHNLIAKLSLNHFALIAKESNAGDYSPIPLSPEILEKAGFVDNGQLIFDFDRFTIRVRKNKPLSVYYLNVWIVDLQYLHTLMNLYFALTGEELTIKL